MKKNFSYTLKKSVRAKRLRLAVYCDGSVVITVPAGARQSAVEKFMADKTQWVLDKLQFFKTADRRAIRVFSHADYLAHKEKALAFARERAEFYNRMYGFSFNNIFIKNQKTRWGSCSKKGNLNFNYKIVLLPQPLADYIVIHELCHLQEFNHSKKFWNLVTQAMPNYLDMRKELQRQGLYLR